MVAGRRVITLVLDEVSVLRCAVIRVAGFVETVIDAIGVGQAAHSIGAVAHGEHGRR